MRGSLFNDRVAQNILVVLRSVSASMFPTNVCYVVAHSLLLDTLRGALQSVLLGDNFIFKKN